MRGKELSPAPRRAEKDDLIKEIPEKVTGFVKLNSCLVGHHARVVRPDGIARLDYEPELVFVIGQRALGVRKADALDYVAGVTMLNDLTDRDLQEREVKVGLALLDRRRTPGLRPVGPELITLDEIADPYDLWMICTVNGEVRMRVNTRDQIWKLPTSSSISRAPSDRARRHASDPAHRVASRSASQCGELSLSPAMS